MLAALKKAYLTSYRNIRAARNAVINYVHNYSLERLYSSLRYERPVECYYPAGLVPYVAE
jgi:putative transposase